MSCFVAVYAAFEHFVFGSRHDFFMADFLLFSQSRLSNQFLMLEDWAWARDLHHRCIYSNSDWSDRGSNIPPTTVPSPNSVNVDCKMCIITNTNTHCTITLTERLKLKKQTQEPQS